MTKINHELPRSGKYQITVGELLVSAQSKLRPISDSPLLDSQILMAAVTNRDRAWLIAHREHQLDKDITDRFEILLERRLIGEPMAYIRGSQEFWQHTFVVGPEVLIPRPETELLVEILLGHLEPHQQQILDLGTGSGAIGISLAAERNAWFVRGIDINEAAIDLARRNSEGLNNIELRVGNWCDGISTNSIDAIVSNPPYVRENDPHLRDLSFEPIEALTSGIDGLSAVRSIISDAYRCLKPSGLLLIEHGYDQQKEVLNLFQRSGFLKIERFNDLNNTPRAVLGYRP